MGEFLAGVAQVDFTPPTGLPLMGNFRDDYAARGVHDRLCARAVVFEDQAGHRAAILSVDICMLDRHNVAMIREVAAGHCALKPEEIFVCATHTHSAPAPMHLGPLPKSPEDAIEAFLTKAASALGDAFDDRRPATIHGGHASEGRVSFNRRLHCRDGQTHMNWEGLDPEFIPEPLGPVDPQISTLHFQRDDRPVGALVNFGLHPAILAGDNWMYSADFPGYLAEGLSRMHGPDFVTVFGNGACGDVNHIDYADPRQGRGFQMAQRVGYMLAVAAFEAMRCSRPPAGSPVVAVSHEKVPLPRLRISSEDLDWCRRVLEDTAQRGPAMGRTDGVPDEYYARIRLKMHELQESDDAVEVMVLRVGETGIVGLPGELFCTLGLAIKLASPARQTLVIGLANDAVGYLPTREAYALGGYEVTPGATKYQPGCGELLVESAVRQLKALFS